MPSLSQIVKGQPSLAGTYSHIGHSDLNVVQIDPSWIIEGAPEVRVKLLHSAPDHMYETVLWECNAGRFRWHFTNFDEVVHIVDGEVTVREDDGSEYTLRAGDTALFPKGSTNVWSVSSFVRKVATLRYHPPSPVDRVKQAVRRGRAELKKLYSQVRPS